MVAKRTMPRSTTKAPARARKEARGVPSSVEARDTPSARYVELARSVSDERVIWISDG
jgi:hypothetical protein